MAHRRAGSGLVTPHHLLLVPRIVHPALLSSGSQVPASTASGSRVREGTVPKQMPEGPVPKQIPEGTVSRVRPVPKQIPEGTVPKRRRTSDDESDTDEAGG